VSDTTPEGAARDAAALRTAARGVGMFDRALVSVSTTIFILVLGLLVVQILSRQLSQTQSWTEELARYLFILSSFLGSAIALRTGEHIRIASFVDRLPSRARLLFDLIADALMIAFLAITAYGAWRMGQRMLHVPVGFSSAFVSIGHIYLALFGCLLLNLYYLFRHLVGTLRGLVGRA
jgi:TRAP-type C4-dicarboxylate transport system permease small subunit